MTAHPIEPSELAVQIADEWLDAHRKGDTWRIVGSLRDEVVRLADALAAAEHRATRAEAQSAIRGRAVVIYRDRARVAEAERDQAYEWAEDQSYPLVMRQGEILTGVANALNGPTPPLTSWSHHDLAGKAAAMVARAEQAEARIKSVRELHQPQTLTSLIDDDCANEMCDHEDDCPTDSTAVVCAECDRVAEAGSPYYGENGVGAALYPCPTIRALDGDA